MISTSLVVTEPLLRQQKGVCCISLMSSYKENLTRVMQKKIYISKLKLPTTFVEYKKKKIKSTVVGNLYN